jgi:predicted nuclease with TOPRIM domain
LKKQLEECSKEKSKLLEEWKLYSTTLRSLGHEVMEPPRGLNELKEEIKKLQGECLSTLGEEGLKILRFLKGEGDFPDDISINGIRNSLKIIRPLFVKFLTEAG